jgi:hypothetical protein
MPLSGGEEREEEEPAAEKERVREEEDSSGGGECEGARCAATAAAVRKFHVSVAAGEGQRSMMWATETVMEEEAVEWLMLVLLQEDVEEEL